MSQHRIPIHLPTLPQPNAQPSETPPKIVSALPWRTWTEGLEEARQRRIPMLVLAEHPWANSTQRIAFVLERDETLRALMSAQVIPVLVDPSDRPDLVAAWRWASIALTGTSGPPLLVFLTHEGFPFLSYCSMQPEGDDRYPSLAALITSTATAYAQDPEPFLDEGRALDAAGRQAARQTATGPTWDERRPELDMVHGGLRERPRHPHPQILWDLLADQDRTSLPADIVEWGSLTLNQMSRGSLYDQLDRGFHRCVRDERWLVPHFEKPIPTNAQLAAVYSRAATQYQDQRFRDIANHLIMFCSLALRNDVDAIGSDSAYYTWTAKEVLASLESATVQVVSLHYNIVPGPMRQALHRAVEMEDMDRYSHEESDILRARLVKGRTQLLAARRQRPMPPVFSLPALSWRAETLRWLFTASAWLKTVDLPELEASLSRLIAGRFDAARGYLRTDADGVASSALLEDQASLLAAFMSCYRATGAQRWLDHARALSEILTTQYRGAEGWLDFPGATAPSRAISDDLLPATLRTLADTFAELTAAVDANVHASPGVPVLTEAARG